MTQPTTKITNAAETAVSELESLELGQPFAEPVATAARFVDALRVHAALEIFPSIVKPGSADTLADYEHHAGGMSLENFGVELAKLHGSALEKHPALTALLRSPSVIGRVGRVAGNRTVVLQRPAHELAAEAITEYQRTVAGQLADAGEYLPYSRILSVDIPVLEGRISTARGLHEKHAAAELRRLDEAQKKADAVIAKEKESAQREADAAAAEAERAATQARLAAEQLEANALADRLERLGKRRIFLEGGHQHSVRELIAVLRSGGFSPERRATIGRFVQRGAR